MGPKSRFLAKKSDFCHTTPILVNGSFVALGENVHFPPWERLSDFTFRSYSRFRKKTWLTHQKVFPIPTVRAPGWIISLNELIGFQTVAAGAALPIAVATIFVEKEASSSTFEISNDGYLPNGSTLTHASALELLDPLFLVFLCS